MNGGRGGLDPELEAFRAAMEAKQKEDEDSPPGTISDYQL